MSQAKAGVNFPTLHPRCRCTTTMNMTYKSRSARNPLTGKSELIDGNVTYAEWKANLSPEQKSALELSKKKDSRRSSDKLQHKQYMDVLGTKNVPRAFDKFQDLKYNDREKWKELKRRYRSEVNPYLQKHFDYDYKGEQNFIPKSTKINVMKNIAGYQSNTVLRDVDRLVAVYGGEKDKWSKRVRRIDSEKYIFDVHCTKKQ